MNDIFKYSSADIHVGKFEITIKQLVIVQNEEVHFRIEGKQSVLTHQKRIRGSFPTAALRQQAIRKAKGHC